MQFIPIDMLSEENAHRRMLADSSEFILAQTVRSLIYSGLSVEKRRFRGAHYGNLYKLYFDGYLTSNEISDAVNNGLITAEEKTQILNSREITQPKVYEYALEKSYGLVDGEHAHVWDWTQTTAPTCTEEGVETATCSKCDKTKTRAVAALGHDWGEWTAVDEATEQRICSRCGFTETRDVSRDT